MRDVCLNGKGHYLGADQTLDVMQSEYIYPDYFDRHSPSEWLDAKKPDPLLKAVKEKEKILSSYFPKHIDDTIDRDIREAFPIFLDRKSMGSQN